MLMEFYSVGTGTRCKLRSFQSSSRCSVSLRLERVRKIINSCWRNDEI